MSVMMKKCVDYDEWNFHFLKLLPDTGEKHSKEHVDWSSHCYISIGDYKEHEKNIIDIDGQTVIWTIGTNRIQIYYLTNMGYDSEYYSEGNENKEDRWAFSDGDHFRLFDVMKFKFR